MSSLRRNQNSWELFDQVRSMMKTKKDNDVINSIGAFYVENDIELSWLIGPVVVYDENQTR